MSSSHLKRQSAALEARLIQATSVPADSMLSRRVTTFIEEEIRDALVDERERILLMIEVAARSTGGKAETTLRGVARAIRASDD